MRVAEILAKLSLAIAVVLLSGIVSASSAPDAGKLPTSSSSSSSDTSATDPLLAEQARLSAILQTSKLEDSLLASIKKLGVEVVNHKPQKPMTDEEMAYAGNPRNPDLELADVFVKRALMYEKIGKLDKARADYATALALPFVDAVPESARAQIFLERAAMLGRIGNIKMALYDIDTAVGKKDNLGLKRVRADFCERYGLYDQATKDWNSLLESYKWSYSVPAADYFARRGDIARARVLYNQNLTEHGAHADPVARGEFFELQGKMAQAASDLSDTTEGALFFERRGELARAANRWEEIRADLKAQILLSLGRTPEALAELAVVDVENFPSALFTYAVILERIGCKNMAKAYFKRCIAACTFGNAYKISIHKSLLAENCHKKLLQYGEKDGFVAPRFISGSRYVPLALVELKP